MDSSYKLFTTLITPLLPLWLGLRALRGKEDWSRMAERFGKSRIPRPKGSLVWIHAASVGEANSVLLLIEKLRGRFPSLKILLTTGTVTSAALMKKRLPQGVLHQYVPVDTPEATQRFIRHWKPDFAFWVESELWPNLIDAARRSHCFMAVINARMSERSFARWQKFPRLIHGVLGAFDCVFAQSEQDAKRLATLGAKNVSCPGNLKFDAALLPCDEALLSRLKESIGKRPGWLAASTHPEEEQSIATAHKLLAPQRPHLLTIIVPRHPERGDAIAETLRKHFRVAQRSKQQPITPDTQFYIADTLGELGLFYRLCEIVFMGGSLVKHGGQNPLEPARLACAIMVGPHTHNFADIYREMEEAKAVLRVKTAGELALQLDMLLDNPPTLEPLQQSAKRWVESKGGAAARIVEALAPALEVSGGSA